MAMNLFSGSKPRKKNTLANRVKRLESKYNKKKKIHDLKIKEAALKQKLSKL